MPSDRKEHPGMGGIGFVGDSPPISDFIRVDAAGKVVIRDEDIEKIAQKVIELLKKEKEK